MNRTLPYKTIINTAGDSDLYAYLVQTNIHATTREFKLLFYTKALADDTVWPVDHGQVNDYYVRQRVDLGRDKIYEITVKEDRATARTYKLEKDEQTGAILSDVDELTPVCFGAEQSDCFGQIKLCPDPLVGTCNGEGLLICEDQIN